jgi:hypothetical protein
LEPLLVSFMLRALLASSPQKGFVVHALLDFGVQEVSATVQ